jgi:hypothetical protein
MKRAVKRKSEIADTGPRSVLRSQFHSFAKLAGQAGDGKPLLRGLRVAHDPRIDRFVVVHGGTRVEFVLTPHGDAEPPYAEIECRRMDAAGATEQATIAAFRFDETGVVSQSTVTELLNERIDDASGAWSIVAAVVWGAMHGQP